jgi:hypothetical protein
VSGATPIQKPRAVLGEAETRKLSAAGGNDR